jgi:hypothetical protein
MVESLATIMSHFSGEANRARCLAHIVNLVAKIILRQFDASKNKNKNKKVPPNVVDNEEIVVDKVAVDEVVVVEVEVDKVVVDENAEESDDFDDERDRVMDKEEKEMDEGGDDEDEEDGQKLLQDAEILEELMKDEIKRVGMKAKPVRQALFKVNTSFLFFCSFFYRSFPSRSIPSLLFFNLPSFFFIPLNLIMSHIHFTVGFFFLPFHFVCSIETNYFFFLLASETRVCHQKFHHNYFASLERHHRRNCTYLDI